MAILNTGKDKVEGPDTSTDKAIPRFDGTTGEFIQNSGITITDEGDILGVNSIRVNGILIDSDDSITAASKLACSIIYMEGNTLTTSGTNQDLIIATSGSGSVTMFADFNCSGDVNFYDNLTVGDTVTIDRISGGTTIKHKTDLGKSIQAWHKKDDTRLAWFGFGSSANFDLTIKNETTGPSAGDIQLIPDNGSGNGHVKLDGYTHLGGSSPGIKMKKLTTTTHSSSTGVKSINHGLTSNKILAITAIVESVSNVGIPPNYEAGSNAYDYDMWFDATQVHIINNGGSITSKAIRILLTYEE